jgi:hypothetical protein
MQQIINQLNAALRQIQTHQQQIHDLQQRLTSKPPSAQEFLDSIPGRRIFYHFVSTQNFTSSNNGSRGTKMTFTVSQDGPFIMTHYPIAMWKPSLPTTATRYGQWMPVQHTNIPAQEIADVDFVDISYEMDDSGAARAFQNNPLPPLLSSFADLKALPIPTLFAPNTTIGFTPTYEDIDFSANGTATTQGTLVVALPGYRVVNS